MPDESRHPRHGGRKSFENTPGSLLVAGVWFAMIIALMSSPCVAQTMPEPTFEETVATLKEKAGAGFVRVIVRVRPNPAVDAPTAAAAQARLVETMRDAGVSVVDPLEGLPLVVMELMAQDFDHLLATGLVENLQEDRIEGAF